MKFFEAESYVTLGFPQIAYVAKTSFDLIFFLPLYLQSAKTTVVHHCALIFKFYDCAWNQAIFYPILLFSSFLLFFFSANTHRWRICPVKSFIAHIPNISIALLIQQYELEFWGENMNEETTV